MLRAVTIALTFLASSASACERPICLVPHDSLRFSKLVDFDDLPTSIGVGRVIEGVLVQDGVRFGEHFAGQSLSPLGDFDQINGAPMIPLTVLEGSKGQSLGTMRLSGTNVLHGHGHRRFPRVEAVGEGAIAVLFDHDQPALSFDIRGGEQGFATVQFLRRDGSVIDTISLGPLAEDSFGFLRQGTLSDIAGFVLLNTDPQGVALDNLRFESAPILG